MAFDQLGSDPVEPTTDAPAIVCVLVAVEGFKNERPLIRAEMNGFSGREVCHEWVACSSFESSVRFYQWSQASAGSAPINTNLSMDKTTTTHFTLGDQRSIHLEHGSIVAKDSSSEIVSIYAGTDAINDAVANLLPQCDRITQERFLKILNAAIKPARVHS